MWKRSGRADPLEAVVGNRLRANVRATSCVQNEDYVSMGGSKNNNGDNRVTFPRQKKLNLVTLVLVEWLQYFPQMRLMYESCASARVIVWGWDQNLFTIYMKSLVSCGRVALQYRPQWIKHILLGRESDNPRRNITLFLTHTRNISSNYILEQHLTITIKCGDITYKPVFHHQHNTLQVLSLEEAPCQQEQRSSGGHLRYRDIRTLCHYWISVTASTLT